MLTRRRVPVCQKMCEWNGTAPVCRLLPSRASVTCDDPDGAGTTALNLAVMKTMEVKRTDEGNILTAKDLLKVLEQLKLQGKKVVFTNGVFDLIHVGHIDYLRCAKSKGDVLVVALNTDDSVRRLKGDKRPILPENERAKIVASLDMVDYVTFFGEDTPKEIIELLRPNVLVKGGDYTLNTIVGRDTVEGDGGTVYAVALVEGVSTSDIIERIVRAGRPN
jgi:rfaE bifunctional protein nucleotidyltransferase chain/domain